MTLFTARLWIDRRPWAAATAALGAVLLAVGFGALLHQAALALSIAAGGGAILVAFIRMAEPPRADPPTPPGGS